MDFYSSSFSLDQKLQMVVLDYMVYTFCIFFIFLKRNMDYNQNKIFEKKVVKVKRRKLKNIFLLKRLCSIYDQKVKLSFEKGNVIVCSKKAWRGYNWCLFLQQF
jgi:hypothetical protein